MKTVWIILPVFKVGGVEKWAQMLFLALQNIYVVKVYVTGDIDPKARDIFPEIKVKKTTKAALLIEALRSKPNYVISALTPANVLVCILFSPLKTKVITSIHLTLQSVSAKSFVHQFYRVTAHYLIFLCSDKVIAVSEGVKRDFCNIVKAGSKKVEVIYNPCFEREKVEKMRNVLSDYNKAKFVSVGRFDQQKNFQDLVGNFVKALDDGRDFTLDIYGDGPEFGQVSALIPLNYKNKIRLMGNQSEIASRLPSYDVFVLSSVYEGFGNVLAEALSAGLFCISRNCPHGPAEILKNGEFGLLIDTNDDLGEYLSGFSKIYSDYIVQVDDEKHQLLKAHLENFTNENFSQRVKLLMSQV